MAARHDHRDVAAWPFPVPVETTVLVAPPVLLYREPVLSVKHDHEGDWHFSDGVSGHAEHAENSCLGCLVAGDATLAAVADLPRGWLAVRFLRELEWERMPAPPPDPRLPRSGF